MSTSLMKTELVQLLKEMGIISELKEGWKLKTVSGLGHDKNTLSDYLKRKTRGDNQEKTLIFLQGFIARCQEALNTYAETEFHTDIAELLITVRKGLKILAKTYQKEGYPDTSQAIQIYVRQLRHWIPKVF